MTSTVIYEGELRTVALHNASGIRIETDAPVDNHGKGREIFSIGSGGNRARVLYADHHGQKARDLNIDLKGTRIEIQKIMKADPRRISGISLTFHLPERSTFTEKNKIDSSESSGDLSGIL